VGKITNRAATSVAALFFLQALWEDFSYGEQEMLATLVRGESGGRVFATASSVFVGKTFLTGVSAASEKRS
jgi:hypothetical protein